MAYMDRDSFFICNNSNIDSVIANAFEVDDAIAPIIQLLNQKGYRTLFSCSGHPGNLLEEMFVNGEVENPWMIVGGTISVEKTGEHSYRIVYAMPANELYIAFEDDISVLPLPDSLLRDGNCVRYAYHYHRDFYEFLSEQLQVCRELYEWAKSLPVSV